MRQADLRVRRGIGHALALVAAALVAVGCGARGPLDFDVVQVVGGGTADASVSGGNNEVDAGPVVAFDAGHPVVDSAAPVVDAAPDANLIQCGTCVATQCGTAIATCLGDTTCSTELQCIATKCLTGTDPTCYLTCAGGNIGGLGTLLPIITCITQTCGKDCGGTLGGLGGIPGIPGSGGNRLPKAAVESIQSTFPELRSER